MLRVSLGHDTTRADIDAFLAALPAAIRAGAALDGSDIESLSVLKDAASAAIYGSKAANGVSLITTKRSVRKTSLEAQAEAPAHFPG